MELTKYREYPGGKVLFGEPHRGIISYAFFGFAVLFTAYLFVDGRAKVALLAGGGLVLLSIPNVLPEKYHLPAVVLRIIGIAYYVTLWVGISVYFPDAPTFFDGNW